MGMASDLEIIKELEKEIGVLDQINEYNATCLAATGYLIDKDETIRWLRLHKRNLKKIPKAVFKLKNLLELSLSETNITDIPDAIIELKKLQILDTS